MSAALDQARLAQLAAELGERHAACEAALNDAVGHALRAGELLIEAKALVAHGEWLPWLGEHFAGSERTAQGYMQLARVAEPRPVADIGVRAALAAIAAPPVEEGAEEQPADEEPEVVDAEPVAEPSGPSILDQLRAADGLEKAAEELRLRDEGTFPRPGVERTTLRQIRKATRDAERHLAHAVRARDLSDWSAAQELAAAAAQHKEACELETELALVLSRRFDERCS